MWLARPARETLRSARDTLRLAHDPLQLAHDPLRPARDMTGAAHSVWPGAAPATEPACFARAPDGQDDGRVAQHGRVELSAECVASLLSPPHLPPLLPSPPRSDPPTRHSRQLPSINHSRQAGASGRARAHTSYTRPSPAPSRCCTSSLRSGPRPSRAPPRTPSARPRVRARPRT